MPAPTWTLTGRWAVCSCWTFEDSLSGYDDNEVVSTHATQEEAERECRRVAHDHIGTIDTKEGRWCIGVGIGAELAAPYVTMPDGEPHATLYWANTVPDEFIQFKEAQA